LPYCGKHALELLEAGESPDKPSQFMDQELKVRRFG
jgi:hypothetical protein